MIIIIVILPPTAANVSKGQEPGTGIMGFKKANCMKSRQGVWRSLVLDHNAVSFPQQTTTHANIKLNTI